MVEKNRGRRVTGNTTVVLLGLTRVSIHSRYGTNTLLRVQYYVLLGLGGWSIL